MKFKKILWLLPFFLLAKQIIGQNNGLIKGQIMDGKIPVEFANVLLFTQSDTAKLLKGVVTDSTGSFVFTALPFDSYIVKMQYIGYLPNAVNVPLDTKQPQFDMGTIPLSIDAKILKTVEISTRKSLIQKTKYSFGEKK